MQKIDRQNEFILKKQKEDLKDDKNRLSYELKGLENIQQNFKEI